MERLRRRWRRWRLIDGGERSGILRLVIEYGRLFLCTPVETVLVLTSFLFNYDRNSYNVPWYRSVGDYKCSKN